jgi:molecular chaperone IbpA
MKDLDIPGFYQLSVGFDDIINNLRSSASDNYPPCNIVKVDDTHQYIEVAVPGFAEDELDVEVTGNKIVISGSKKKYTTVGVEMVDYLHRGIGQRNFVRTFALGRYLKPTGGEVTNGILRVDLELIVPDNEKPNKLKLTFNK